MFLPYYGKGTGKISVPRHSVRSTALPTALEDMPTPRPTAALMPVEPFELDAVQLETSSRFGVAQRTNAAFLRALDPDRLLFFFRRVAKLPQPREGIVPYGGWESQGSGLRGEFSGHYLHAAASVAAAASDTALAARCEYVVRVLEECQGAMGDGYVSAFPQQEFAAVESFESKSPWVPYYVMHKLLAGLLVHHELMRSPRSLQVATTLATHLRQRVAKLLARGLPVWHDFINQEVGGMSEALADLARLTRNASWLQLAGMFERPCFIGPLARGEAAGAIEKVHANTHLPQLLGAMARYEATGDAALRTAAVTFWDELHSRHTYVTGGSTAGEVWGKAGALGDTVTHQHAGNYWAHDHAETCVAHNSMRVARRLMTWSSPNAAAAAGGAETEAAGLSTSTTLRHAAYYERTLYNAVLGTQRGTNPGEMLYMLPMGSGVSKAGIPNAPQGHHWSDGEHHFWCCQGSGIEAFARLGDAIYWRRKAGADAPRAQLLVLQLLPSELLWKEQGLRASIRGDHPGSTGGGQPIRLRFELASLLTSGAVRAAGLSAGVDVWVRIPEWAAAGGVKAVLGGRLVAVDGVKAVAGSLLALRLEPGAAGAAGAADGWLDLRLEPAVLWEPIKDSRPGFRILQAPMVGPLILAALTYGRRALPLDARLLPVPTGSVRSSLFSIRVSTAAGGEGDADGDGCLVSRWSSVWVVRSDRSRTFIQRPPVECMKRAAPIEEALGDFPQLNGGAAGYKLDDDAAATACERYDACVMPQAVSAFASRRHYIMHTGTDSPLALAAPPPTVPGTRRGGTDAANAATWRLTDAPVGVAGAPVPAGAVWLESFDSPGLVIAPTSGAGSPLRLVSADANDPSQLWIRAAAAGAAAKGTAGVLLENAASRGHYLSVADVAASEARLLSPHRGAAISKRWRLVLGRGTEAAPVELDEPFAEYAATSYWLAPPAGARGAAASPPPPFLLMPLNELNDEHYTIYLCRPSSQAEADKPPRFCQ